MARSHSADARNRDAHALVTVRGCTPFHRYSYRSLVLLVCGGLILTVCLPYLLFGGGHPDSCYIVRQHRTKTSEPTRVHDALNATVTGIDLPAVEAVESSPEKGRTRIPKWYYQNQTAIMIALLVACMAIKLAYALRHMRPTVRLHAADEFSAESPVYFRSHWWEVFRLLYTYMWYLGAYFLCNALKSILADFSCSTHGNSVSGHYLFHTYSLWMIGYLHLTQKLLHTESILTRAFWSRLVTSRQGAMLDLAFMVLYPIYVCVVVSILADTYFYGFHSLRQIIYGFTLALVVFLGCTGVLESIEDRLATRGWRPTKPAKENHTISHAYQPIVATMLHEWFYADERVGRFYQFPLVALFTFQVVGFLSILSSPTPGYFHLADLLAVLIGDAALVWMWRNKLQIPNRP